MGLGKLIREGSLFISCRMSFLKTDDVSCLVEGGDMFENVVMSGVGTRLARVVRDGVNVVEDHPGMRDGRVEGAGGPVDTVGTHLLVSSGLFLSSWIS